MKKPERQKTVSELLKSTKRQAARKERARAKREAERSARVPGEGYEPCIVSFIDVLGFRSLLNSRHAFDIRDVLLKLRSYTAPIEDSSFLRQKGKRLLSRAYSDSVSDAVVRVRVFNTQFSDGAFFHELLDLLHAQIQCINSGVVIRAGVAVGDAHVGPNGKGPVFGPAMVRAYEIETNEAIHPRIVVDETAYQRFLTDPLLRNEDHDLQEELDYVDRLLRVDEDGKRFIDYLGASETEFDDAVSYFSFLNHHSALVREKLATTCGRVREKFEWLSKYHNSVVHKMLEEFNDGVRSVEEFEIEWGSDPTDLLRATLLE